MSVLLSYLILLLATSIPAAVTLILAYNFRVDEDSYAVFTSVPLGTALFMSTVGSTVVNMLYGMKV